MTGTATQAIHARLRSWVNRLDMYKEDLKVLIQRIEKVARGNSSQEVMAMVEHFQNQFIIQKNEMDEFRHAINEFDNHVSLAEAHPEREQLPSQQRGERELQERMERFETLFHELRMDVMRFVEKNA